ncbi:MAG: hypothetical protein ACI9OJ_001677 [Myxococcota bacterium]|jgi:hypothetical protein
MRMVLRWSLVVCLAVACSPTSDDTSAGTTGSSVDHADAADGSAQNADTADGSGDGSGPGDAADDGSTKPPADWCEGGVGYLYNPLKSAVVETLPDDFYTIQGADTATGRRGLRRSRTLSSWCTSSCKFSMVGRNMTGDPSDAERLLPAVQAILDAGDPAVWARHTVTERFDDAAPPAILMVLGLEDEIVPMSATPALARGLGVPVLEPVLVQPGVVGTVVPPVAVGLDRSQRSIAEEVGALPVRTTVPSTTTLGVAVTP